MRKLNKTLAYATLLLTMLFAVPADVVHSYRGKTISTTRWGHYTAKAHG